MVLGLKPMSLNDALADPMAEVFDPAQTSWTFDAHPAPVLRSTKLPLPPAAVADASCSAKPRRTALWWAAAMKGQDFREEDHLNVAAYNLALWRGLKGDAPYPTSRDGRDLRGGRAALLAGVGEGCD
jgi:hypothetical protein